MVDKEIEQLAMLLCKLQIGWHDTASAATLWRPQRPEVKRYYREKARWLREQLQQVQGRGE